MKKMMIYTNNNGPKEWVHSIVRYFEHKIQYKLVDQIISAFKINGQFIEFGRTTHDKTHSDFIRCTKLPAHAEICYLDDTFYPAMSNDCVYYINVKPYHYDLPFDILLQRLKKNIIGQKIGLIEDEYEKKILDKMTKYNYQCVVKDTNDYSIDAFLGEDIIHHLHIFFRTKPKTLRRTFRKPKHVTRRQKIEIT